MEGNWKEKKTKHEALYVSFDSCFINHRCKHHANQGSIRLSIYQGLTLLFIILPLWTQCWLISPHSSPASTMSRRCTCWMHSSTFSFAFLYSTSRWSLGMSPTASQPNKAPYRAPSDKRVYPHVAVNGPTSGMVSGNFNKSSQLIFQLTFSCDSTLFYSTRREATLTANLASRVMSSQEGARRSIVIVLFQWSTPTRFNGLSLICWACSI